MVCVKVSNENPRENRFFVLQMRIGVFLLFFLAFNGLLFAGDDDSTASRNDAVTEAGVPADDAGYSDEIVLFELDRLPVTDSLFSSHVQELEFVIPMDYNADVKTQIDYFSTRWQSKLKEVITRSEFYFPIYEEILDKYEMPLELKYLSVIESALNPYARSRVGALGLWQFMPATGRLFDLEQDQIMDERRSVEKSTAAAAAYLKSMYEMFGDWHLAIASYNCGPGNVRKAMRRSGRTDFWGIQRFLPRETQKYVPKFIAMAYVMNFYDHYGIRPSAPKEERSAYHQVFCQGAISFQVLSEFLNMSGDEIMDYNPELKARVIPSQTEGYWLNLPEEKVNSFYEMEQEILECSVEHDLAKEEWEEAKPKLIIHQVKRGECLPVIAKRYGCSVSQLKSWNNLRGSVIHPNQRLKIQLR